MKMKENLNLTYDKRLGKSISEVTSISLETDYDVNETSVIGKFTIEGSYKTHGLCLNQEEINFDIPFEYPLKEDTLVDSVKVEVTDFTYNIEADTLCVNIDYEVIYDLEEISDEKDLEELDRFIKSHEVDLINLSEDDFIEDELPQEEVEETCEPELDELEEERELSYDYELASEEEKVEEEEVNVVTDTILDSVTTQHDEYITYHIYVCNESDTIESISEKYKVDTNLLREYNANIEIKMGAKLIIPCSNE